MRGPKERGATGMDSSLEASDAGQTQRRITALVDRNWRIRALVEQQGALKLAAPLVSGTSLLDLIHPDDVEILGHNRDWCAANNARNAVLRIRYTRGQDWWLPLLTTLRCAADG